MPDVAGSQRRVGIEHIGMTVPDIAAASRYLERVFGAEVMFDRREEHAPDPPDHADYLGAIEAMDLESVLGVPGCARIRAVRMLSLHDGPLIELFEYDVVAQRPAVAPSDLGLQHICIHVDDIDVAAARVLAAGGHLFAGPREMHGVAPGSGQFRYTRAPWGATIELICYPLVSADGAALPSPWETVAAQA
jgi:catechol 2,3-dioxygenase-like lactoylglutathione lyase family enzyme